MTIEGPIPMQQGALAMPSSSPHPTAPAASTPSPPLNGTAIAAMPHKADGAGAGATPAGGSQGVDLGGAAAASAPAVAAGSGGAAASEAAASPPSSPQDEAARAAEDAVLKRGQEIAGVRALLARAFSRPAEEPAQPRRHWDFLLEEMRWLAVDVTQERLWKQTAAMAVALEVARQQGAFGLRQPPKDQRRYSDELRRLRDAAAKEAAVAAGKRPTAAAKAAENGGLRLDPADDPIFAELEMLDLSPGTPPPSELSLAYQHNEGFSEAVHELLLESDVERLIGEEIAYREYRHEFEAALISHHLAIQEENRRAIEIDPGIAVEGGMEMMGEEFAEGEEGEEGGYLPGGRQKAKRRKQAAGAGSYLLDEFKDLDTESIGNLAAGNKRSASRAQIEETYFRKKRRERYRDVDADYDVRDEPGTRYATRRTSTAGAARVAQRVPDAIQKRKSTLGRSDSFVQQQQMMRGRGNAAGVTGMVLWSKAEDDLLLAIAHEFSGNWTLVSEVLSLSLSMQGIYRPPTLCKQRFRQITTPENGEYNEELALLNLSQTLTKQQAREMLMASLPVRDDVLMPLMEALVQIGAAAKSRRQADEKKNDPVRRQRQEPHASHAAVHSVVMQQTGNRTMTPLELGEAVNAAFTQQAKAQQIMQQAAMQAQTAAVGAPAAAPAAAAAAQQGTPKLPGQPGAPLPGVLPPGSAAVGTPGQPGMQQQQQAAQQQPQAPGAGMPGAAGQPGMPPTAGTPAAAAAAAAAMAGMQAPMQGGLPPLSAAQFAAAAAGQQLPAQLAGAPGSAQARPLLPPQGVTPQAMAQAAAAAAMAQQQQAAQASAGAAGGAAPLGMPQQGAPGAAQGLAPGQTPQQQQQQQLVARQQAAAQAAQQAAKNQVTLQQLNHILATNLLPNGTALPPEMRKQIEEKRNTYLAKTQAQQAQLANQARQQAQAAQIALQQQAAAAAAVAAAQQQQQHAGPPGSAGGQPGAAQPQVQQPGAPPGAGGMPANAAAAALHAAQQAVAMQQQQQQQGAAGPPQGAPGVAVRPPGLPPGLYAMQGLQPGASLALASGAAGQPMALPPGVMPSVSHQMSLAAAAQLQAQAGNPGALPPGMQAATMALPAGLTPQQQQLHQQLLAQQQQQLLAQQQAAAQAAAAQQAAANQAAAQQAQQAAAAAAPQQQHVQGT
ncbi:hypothetical protein N2152v2_006866 [Parachlorella kessleri]